MMIRGCETAVAVAIAGQFVCSGLGAAPAQAADLDWFGTGGLLFYDTDSNWNPVQVPTTADNLTFSIDVAGTPIIIGATSGALNIDVTDNDWEFTGAAGGVLNSDGALTIDDVLGTTLANGTNVVVSNDLTWNNAGDIIVGNIGYGSLTLQDGSDLDGLQIFVGNSVGAVGEITLTGSGTTLTARLLSNTGVHTIGNFGGTGTLNVLAGADLRTTSTSFNDIWVGSGLFDPDPIDPLNPVTRSTGTLNIDGAGSFAETEDLHIGVFGGLGFLNITNGGQVINTDSGTNGTPDTFIGNNAGSVGTAVVDGDGSLLRSRAIRVGVDGGTGTLEVTGGGLARTLTQGTAGGFGVIGDQAGSDGQVAVYGSGASASTLDVDDDLWVGNAGVGVLRIGQQLNGTADGSGALQVDVDLFIGDDAGNTGDNKVIVDGANATANVDNVTYVGLNGTGTLEVTNGAQFTGRFLRVGQFAGSDGTLLIDGTDSLLNTDSDTPDTTDDTVIGLRGTAVATVSNGGTLRTDQLWVGFDTDGDGTLIVDNATVNAGVDNQGTGSNVMIGGRTDAGTGSTGSVTIQNGGVMTSAVQTIIGGNATGVGSLTVTGVGSLFDNFDGGTSSNDILRIGQDGAGTAQVLDGGRIEAEGILIGNANNALAADLLVSGSNGGTASTVWTGGYLFVGNARRGTMTVEQGAQVSVANSIATERIIIGDDNSADGSRLTITDAGSRVDYHGTGDVSVGNAGGAAANRAILEVLSGGVFSAVQRDTGGAITSQARIIIGDLTNGNGQITIDGAGSLVEASVIYVGDGGSSSSGILDITNGGAATTTGEFQAGSNGNGVGTVNVDGPASTLTVGTTLSLGDDFPGNGSATGNLNITTGGTVTNGGQAYIGHFNGSFGTATVGSTTANTSSWTVGGELTLAGTETSSQSSGFGVLNINDGGLVEVASNLRIRSLGDVNLDGGELRVGGALIFTDAGSTLSFNQGTLRLNNGAGFTLNTATLANIFNNGDQTLGAGQHLAVDHVTVISAPLRVAGGTLSLGVVSTASFANVTFGSGTLNFTDSAVIVTAAGLFGSALIIDEDETINIANSLFIQADGLLNVARGSVSAGGAVNSGTVIIAEAEADFGAGLSNSGDLILIDAITTGTITNNGDLTVVNNSVLSALTLGSGGDVAFGIETAAGTADSLTVTGNAVIAGALSVSADGAATFTLGDEYNLITAASVTGTFDTTSLPTLTGGLGFDVLYEATRVALAVIALNSLTGDYNADGFVSQGDLDLVLLNWGDTTAPAGFDENALAGGGPFDNLISQNELDGVLLNWGNGTPPVAAIPEPTSALLILTPLLAASRRRKTSH